MKSNWIKKVFFGTNKETGERVWLDAPSWSCGWYWGFGYLGSKNCHYHLSNYRCKEHVFKLEDGSYKVLTEQRNKSIYDCLLEDYDLNPRIKDNLWKFCELVGTCYSLKETAEVLGRGGSHYTTNPCQEVIKNEEEVERINKEVLPSLFNELHKIFVGE